MNRTTVKTSTIFVSEGKRTQVFRSLDEMPVDMRRRLEKTTSGMHAATILIADRRGRDEIARAMNGQPSEYQSKIAAQVSGQRKASEREELFAETARRIIFSKWVRYGVPVAIGVSIWLLFQIR